MVLDKTKVLAALRHNPLPSFSSYQHQIDELQTLWNHIISDDHFYQKVLTQAQQETVWLPEDFLWVPVSRERPESYIVSAVDGSQIFPNAHVGMHGYLLNIGMCTLSYLLDRSSAHLTSEPFFFEPDTLVAEEKVSAHRTFLELKKGTELTSAQKNHLLLFDGPLVPYQKSFEAVSLNEFVDQWKNGSARVAGYMSMPQSRLVSSLLDIAARLLQQPYDSQMFSDSTLLAHIMPSHHRTALWHIPHEPYRRYFFYHTGYEIARIEIPAYLATSENMEALTQIIQHQVSLGYGYPLVLAEAHLQATVSVRDQQWFYAMLAQCNPLRAVRSYKQLRKQRILL
jgi:hypothetical protein